MIYAEVLYSHHFCLTISVYCCCDAHKIANFCVALNIITQHYYITTIIMNIKTIMLQSLCRKHFTSTLFSVIFFLDNNVKAELLSESSTYLSK